MNPPARIGERGVNVGAFAQADRQDVRELRLGERADPAGLKGGTDTTG